MYAKNDKPRFEHYSIRSPDEIVWDLEGNSDLVLLIEIDLAPLVSEVERYRPFLSSEELMRVRSMVHEKDRDAAICSFGVRREILGRYLSLHPHEIQFGENHLGKPFVLGINQNRVSFNLSHSKDRFIIGLCKGREIGVDIQYIDLKVPVLHIAARFFQEEETTYLRNLSDEQVFREFYQIWTMREAYCKAIGTGLSLPIEEIPLMNPSSLTTNWLSGAGSTWFWYQRSSWNMYCSAVMVSKRT